MKTSERTRKVRLECMWSDRQSARLMLHKFALRLIAFTSTDRVRKNWRRFIFLRQFWQINWLRIWNLHNLDATEAPRRLLHANDCFAYTGFKDKREVSLLVIYSRLRHWLIIFLWYFVIMITEIGYFTFIDLRLIQLLCCVSMHRFEMESCADIFR